MQDVEPFGVRRERRLAPHELGGVDRDDQRRLSAGEGHRVRDDVDVDQPTVLQEMAPETGGASHLSGHRRHRRDAGSKSVQVLRGPDVADPHPEELLPRVTVLRDGGGVDFEEGERLHVVHPHGERIVGEQKPEGGLAFPQRHLGLPKVGGDALGPRACAQLGPRHAEERTADGQPDEENDDERRDAGFPSQSEPPGDVRRRDERQQQRRAQHHVRVSREEEPDLSALGSRSRASPISRCRSYGPSRAVE